VAYYFHPKELSTKPPVKKLLQMTIVDEKSCTTSYSALINVHSHEHKAPIPTSDSDHKKKKNKTVKPNKKNLKRNILSFP
jgi:hypothetical protein